MKILHLEKPLTEIAMTRSLTIGWLAFTFVLTVGPSIAFPQTIPAVDPSPVQETLGALVICGGGRMPDSVFESLRKRAGSNAKLVVIPTASIRADEEDYSERTIKLWNSRGFEAVTLLHTRDKKMADSEAFVKPLETATAVWIGGGSQSKIADAYLGTRTEKALYAFRKRGGVIGGTSAGAAIMSKVMIAFGSPKPTIKTGFDLLENAIIDQHFVKRKRQPRLEAAIKANPTLIGYGIDEGTALVVDGSEKSVVGKSTVTTIRADKSSFVVSSFSNGEKISARMPIEKN